MEIENLKTKMRLKIKSHSTSMLKESAELLSNDFREGSDLVYEMVLDELEHRLSESDFITFSEYLETLMEEN